MSKFCQNCGAEMADTMNFCPKCHQKVESGVAASAASPGSSGKKTLAIVGVIVSLLLIGGGIVFFSQQQSSSPKSSGGQLPNAGATSDNNRSNREQAMQTSVNNLKNFMTAFVMYAGNNNDKFPQDLTTLVKEEYLTDPKCYLAPQDSNRKPFSGNGVLPENTSYVYVGKG